MGKSDLQYRAITYHKMGKSHHTVKDNEGITTTKKSNAFQDWPHPQDLIP